MEITLGQDDEANRFSARATRYARLGVNAGAFAARVGANRLSGADRGDDARAFTEALGRDEGPDDEGRAIARDNPRGAAGRLFRAVDEPAVAGARRWAPPSSSGACRPNSAPTGAAKFAEFDLTPAAAASLGQVHRATTLAGEKVACKLQYPDMASAVEADLTQLKLLFSLHRRMGAAIDTREVSHEIAERLREELDYEREAKLAALYRLMLADQAGRARARGRRGTLVATPADARMDGRREAARVRGELGRDARAARDAAVRGVVASVPALRRHPRRSASRQLFRRRDRAGAGAADRGAQSLRLRLRAHLPAALRQRRRRALSRR